MPFSIPLRLQDLDAFSRVQIPAGAVLLSDHGAALVAAEATLTEQIALALGGQSLLAELIKLVWRDRELYLLAIRTLLDYEPDPAKARAAPGEKHVFAFEQRDDAVRALCLQVGQSIP